MKTVKTTYTCDRCGGDAGYAACNGNPPSPEAYLTVGLYGAGPPTKAALKDLCRACHDDLEAWLRLKTR